jgi:subfamily B ATP-binding cassette protein MsbA
MAEQEPRGKYGNLLRFYRYTLPYWRIIVLCLLAMMVYSSVNLSAIALVRPIVKSLERGQDAAAEDTGPAVTGGDSAGNEAETIEGRLKERATGWFPQLKIVRDAAQWLWGTPSLKRVAFVLVAVIGPLFLLSGFLQEYLQGRVVWSVLAQVRVDVFNRLSSLSLGYFGGQRTGELVSRLTNDISNTGTALKIVFGTLFLEPIMAASFLAGAFWASWQLTVVSLLAAPVFVILMRGFGRRIHRHATKTLERLADVTDSMTQLLSGIRVVKAFNMENAERRDFRDRNKAQLQRAFKLVRSRALAGVLPEFFVVTVPTAVTLLVADQLLGRGRLTIDNMLMCCTCLALVGGRFRRIVKAYNDLQASMAGVDRTFELLDTTAAIEDSSDSLELTRVEEGIRFDGVWFAYNGAPVLKGLDLFVPSGKQYAIVGETGAGKSTMLDLIPRFYDTTRGAILIDGIDVRRIRRDSLMRQIAIVGQHPFLFNRPIAENIRYGKPAATDEEVVAAAKAANIHGFISRLPDGYQTNAGEMGSRFSGGQRQCLTIARAILKDAPILILDEATSSLDAESEMLVQTALSNLMRGRTTLVIAHRLSTVRHADCIIVLKDGRIAEQGSHEELLAAEGEYHRLYRLQFAGTEPEGSDAEPGPSDASDGGAPTATPAPPGRS